MRCCKNHRLAIMNLKVVSAVGEGELFYRAFVTLKPRSKVDRDHLFAELRKVDGILDFTEIEVPDSNA